MERTSSKSWLSRSWMALVVVAAGACGLVAAGCDDDNDISTPGIDLNRTYRQIERLGNPLVSEVLFAKRDHGFHNATGPSSDVNNFTDDVQSFVFNVAGRDTSVATTLSAVLLPDMLIVETDRDGATAQWLSWALVSGYGGRKLSDDAVDIGLGALFGDTLDPDNVTKCLTTDNVDANDVGFGSTFPYLAPPH